jgi:methionine-rich copper-binding protein CopC
MVLISLLFLLTGLPLAAKVLLHADYARSEPAADAVLTMPPTTVKVWFTQELFRRDGENWLHVTGPDGARVDVGEAAVDDNDRTLLTVSLAESLADGAYRVEWRALSADDGHAEEGEFAFSVGTTNPAPTQAAPTAASAPEATAAPQPAAQPSAPSPTSGLPCLGAAPLTLLVVGAVRTRRKTIR